MTSEFNPHASREADYAYGRIDFPEQGSDDSDILKLIAVGTLQAVNICRHRLHQLGYAEPKEWSAPLPATSPGKVMRILTKRLPPASDG
ncbi:MAG: hypothetical protein WBA10_05120 [Elainellaceae cyanobacterium]